MNTSHYYLFSALILSVSYVNSLTPEQIQILQENISNRLLRDGNVPGISLSVVQDGELVLSQGYGLSNIEQAQPATNETLYNVGSLSKMISSLLITRLLNQNFPSYGEGVLDVPINTLVPGFNLTFNDRYRTEYATFRDLLSHKVCIDSFMLDTIGAVGAISKADVVYLQRYMGEICHFRNIQMSYNNALIQVAAAAAEFINGDGTPFEDLLESFFDEIGMNQSHVIRETDNLGEIPNMSQPYYYKDNQLHPFNKDLLKRSAVIPSSAGILTSSNDMALYMQLLINKGKVGDRQVISEDIYNWVTRLSTPYRFDTYKQNEDDRPYADIGYGIGLILGIHDNWQVLKHSGWNPPYSTLMQVYPALKLGIFTSASGPSWTTDHYYVHFQVWDMVRGYIKSFEDVKSHLPAESGYESQTGPEDYFAADTQLLFPNDLPLSKPPVVPPTLGNTKRINHSLLVGTYGLPIAGSFNISNVDNRTLYFQYGKWGTGFLVQREATPSVYDAVYDTDLVHHFYSQNANPPDLAIDFVILGLATVHYNGGRFAFIKGYQMNLPEIPWDPSSCGPAA